MRILVGLCLLMLVGCSDGVKLYPVHGTVTLDGEPIEGLMVAFAPEDGGISGAGRTDANGEYTITCTKGKGLPAGNYNVAISEVTAVDNASETEEVYQSSDSAAYEQMASGAGSMSQYQAAERQKKNRIPEKYNAQSTLKEIVAETDNEIDFALSSN